MPVMFRRAAYELCELMAAGAFIALLVLLAGEEIGRAAASVPAAAIQPVTAVSKPVHTDVNIDSQDAVLTTRRKAAAREIERQWHEPRD